MEWVIINRTYKPYALLSRRIYQIIKRIMDVLICVVTLPVTVPAMLICALIIRLDSSGPAIFVQERIGKDGQPFRLYKFRTMQHQLDDRSHRAFMKAFVHGDIGGQSIQGEEPSHRLMFIRAFVDLDRRFGEGDVSHSNNGNGRIYKPIHMSQVTRVGRFLRKTSLDELPQIFNVLKGEMSLVGPRPNVPWEVEEYRPWHYERLDVLPGITGLAQVKGRSGINFDTIVKYDIEYVENQSLLLDLKILWWTVRAVLLATGAE
ncbi:MAG TPA: sugar transferase [Chloroflexi bacterium]|nr:sugar transferase [Chloroflexota bacterium]